MRIALGIEYDGSTFYGWQIQPDLITVQSALETALSKVADHPVAVTCAGRTDTGVHALGQVVHFDTLVKRPARAWMLGVNSNLPKHISVRWIQFVNDDFHARFSAQARRYHYVIYNNPVRPTLMRSGVAWYYPPLQSSAMNRAVQYLIGEHDFTSFRAANCNAKNPVREIYHFDVKQRNHFIILDVKANGFLHRMVRNLVGVLLLIGSGKKDPSWMKSVLQAKDRSLGACTAPAKGLYLSEVEYPLELKLPKQDLRVFFLSSCC